MLAGMNYIRYFVSKFDPTEPRDPRGRWVHQRMAELKAKYPVVAFNYPRDTGTEMGSIEAHTKDVGREWDKQLTHEELAGISERFGSDVEKLMASAIPLHDIGKAQAIESGGGKENQHEYTTPILQEVLRKEGFSEKDVSLATELINHDLIGPLFRWQQGKDAEVAAKLMEKAHKVGMNSSDFAKLQLSFYQADASAYPYITQYMTHEPSGKWTFKGSPKIAAIEALITRKRDVQSVAKFSAILKFDPSQPRNPKGSTLGGQWVSAGVAEGGVAGEKWVPNARQFTSEEGYQWHEKGPGAEWAKTLPYEDAEVLGSYAGFTYRQINELRRGKEPTQEGRVRGLTDDELKAVQASRQDENSKADPIPPEGPAFRYTYRYENIPKDTPAGSAYLAAHWAVTGPVPDPERSAEITAKAARIDDLIANRGLVLTEPITVLRGAYIPGLTFKQLQDMEYEGLNGEPPAILEEKGFSSTMLGDARGRAKSYPALAKFESLYQRFGGKSDSIRANQDEEGTAIQFHITLPAGTKVASVEAARRIRYEFPRVQDPTVFEHPEWTADGKTKPEDYTKPDYTQQPKVDARDLENKDQRTESEILLGSGAKFRVVKVLPGYIYPSGDPTLKPVQVRDVYLEYIGGGSSDPHGGK